MGSEINRRAEEELSDLHRGLHLAMDALIKRKDYRRAEEVLHEMDQRFSEFFHRAKVR